MPKEQILIIEDEPSIREILTLYLERSGYMVVALEDGDQADRWLKEHLPDLIIMDLMLPGIDGYALTARIRARSDVPIIMLTSRREEVDRIAGLEMGADDYVVKPFSPQEVVSRVRAVLRRAAPRGMQPGEPITEIGDLVIDPNTREVTKSGELCELTAREFDLLNLLAKNPRRVFSRDQLLDQVWGGSDFIDPGTVTVHIRRLREKIEEDASQPQHLITIWGVGYRFDP